MIRGNCLVAAISVLAPNQLQLDIIALQVENNSRVALDFASSTKENKMCNKSDLCLS